MAAHPRKPDLIAIVGPTASGKSDLAVKVAAKHHGEIIAADSRTVFKGLDIGTAKPTDAEQELVKHWGLDLINLGQRFTAADFKKYALKKVEEIAARGKLAILVGGTGLYVDSVLYDFEFGPDADPGTRAKLEQLNINKLQSSIDKAGLKMPRNSLNKRHLIRTIEKGKVIGGRSGLRPNTLLIGLMPGDEALKARIAKRANKIFKAGVINETERLMTNFPDSDLAQAGIVYKLCSEVLAGSITKDEAIRRFSTLDWQYARRQRTWFKRNPDIHWFETSEEAASFIDKSLNT